MYKLLLCWRYLKTRYLAMACIVSVMLGVATLIVVNSVMSGFSTKLRDRLHGLLSDIVVEARGLEGFTSPGEKIERIRRNEIIGPRLQALTATMEIFAMLQYDHGRVITQPVKLIGVEAVGRSSIGGFKEFLVKQKKAERVAFDLPEDVKAEYERRERWLLERRRLEMLRDLPPGELPPPAPPPSEIKIPCGVIVGNLIASRPVKDEETKETSDRYFLEVGDSVVVTTVSGQKMAPVFDRFVVVDYFKSGMSEYDQNIIFVPLEYLQHLRTAQDTVTSIQIKLKNFADAALVKAELERTFKAETDVGMLQVMTWEDKQGPLLAAISIEKGILNILLFLIVGVAGFGILAIFSMIVAEKTRDIGILKALGASNIGVMKIFLSYGLLLGVVGAGLGSLLGLWITNNINAVERFIADMTGQEVFDRKIYYFSEIPTHTEASMVFLVNLGSIVIAILFSVLPALRAALLHPVRALRYEG